MHTNTVTPKHASVTQCHSLDIKHWLLCIKMWIMLIAHVWTWRRLSALTHLRPVFWGRSHPDERVWHTEAVWETVQWKIATPRWSWKSQSSRCGSAAPSLTLNPDASLVCVWAHCETHEVWTELNCCECRSGSSHCAIWEEIDLCSQKHSLFMHWFLTQIKAYHVDCKREQTLSVGIYLMSSLAENHTWVIKSIKKWILNQYDWCTKECKTRQKSSVIINNI